MWAPGLLGLLVGHLLGLGWSYLYGERRWRGLLLCQECGLGVGGASLLPVVGVLASSLTCHRCACPLPVRALVLPIAGGGLGVASYFSLGPQIGPALLGALFGVVLLALTITDLERRLLPNRLTYTATFLALVLSWGWEGRGPVEAAAGAGFGAIALGLAYLLLRGGLGAGDVKLAIFIGAVVGFPRVVGALMVGVLAGGVGAALLLLFRLARRGHYMPYGPFLALGGGVGLFLWDALPHRLLVPWG